MPITLCSPRCLRLTGAGMFIGLLLSGVPQTSFAQTCVQDEYGKNLQCTANDVRIAKALSVQDPITGATILNCTAGSTFSFVAQFQVVTTATARENIGMYFATAGQASARTGTCADNIISPLHDNPAFPRSTNPSAPQLGTSQYEELDTSTPTDTCGDISTSDNNQLINVYVQNALCKAGANGQVALPNCTSWQQPGGTNLCVSHANQWEYPPAPAAVPGSPSKCNCDNTFTIPVQVQNPSLSVAKTCQIGSGSVSNTECDFVSPNLEGGQVSYGVTLTNTSNFGSVIIDQVCDSYYGPLYTASGYTTNNCVAAKTVSSNTCASMGTWTLSTSPSTCSFQANVLETSTINDVITVYGHGSNDGPISPSSSNSITVKSFENPTTMSISAGITNPTANNTLCADVTYNVSAANTSPTDESPISLTGLSETNLGPLATANGTTVLATSCTASVTSPASLSTNGAPYTCTFRTHFCGAPADVVATPGTCDTTAHTCTAGKPNTTACNANSDCDVHCNGIQQSVTINGAGYGDEGVADTNITITPGTKTVTECVQQAAFF